MGPWVLVVLVLVEGVWAAVRQARQRRCVVTTVVVVVALAVVLDRIGDITIHRVRGCGRLQDSGITVAGKVPLVLVEVPRLGIFSTNNREDQEDQENLMDAGGGHRTTGGNTALKCPGVQWLSQCLSCPNRRQSRRIGTKRRMPEEALEVPGHRSLVRLSLEVVVGHQYRHLSPRQSLHLVMRKNKVGRQAQNRSGALLTRCWNRCRLSVAT